MTLGSTMRRIIVRPSGTVQSYIISVLGLINQETTLIKKETAHQLPAQDILQRETVDLATCSLVSSNIL